MCTPFERNRGHPAGDPDANVVDTGRRGRDRVGEPERPRAVARQHAR